MADALERLLRRGVAVVMCEREMNANFGVIARWTQCEGFGGVGRRPAVPVEQRHDRCVPYEWLQVNPIDHPEIADICPRPCGDKRCRPAASSGARRHQAR
jgi:hypothetical protein